MSTTLGQNFKATSYSPSKASVYLRPVGESSGFFNVSSTSDTVIDAANFRSYYQGYTSIVFSNNTSGSTGSGCLSIIGGSGPSSTGLSSIALSQLAALSLNLLSEVSFDTGSASGDPANIIFPIHPSTDGQYYLNLRIKGYSSVAIYLNNYYSGQVTGISSDWHWVHIPIIFSNTQLQYLLLQFLQGGLLIDKLVISKYSYNYSGTGPSYSDAPYVTLHSSLFNTVNNIPSVQIDSYDAINTFDHVKQEGWYNFYISPINNSISLSSNMGITVTASGNSYDNYVIWDVSNSYSYPSFSYNNSTYTLDTNSSLSLSVYSFLNSIDQIDCTLTTVDAPLKTSIYNNFTDLSPVDQNTGIQTNPYGGEEVYLDIGKKIVTVVLDESGSESWNDVNKKRHTYAKGVLSAINDRYGDLVSYNLVKIKSEKAFSFLLTSSTQIDEPTPSNIIKANLTGLPTNIVGFRVIRNSVRYPNSPIDGEIVNEGYCLAGLDTELSLNTQYYYTVFTYDQYNRFSYGVPITATTNTVDLPRGIPSFSTTVYDGYDLLRDSNFIAQWNMDEGSGQYVYDFSDSALTLALSETRWIDLFDCPTGLYGLRFGGFAYGASNTTAVADFSTSADFSIMGWIAAFSKGTKSVIAARSSPGFNWAVVLDSGNIKFTFNGTVFYSCTQSISLETWYHFSIIYVHSSNSLNFYINGSLINTVHPSASALIATSMKLSIGKDLSGTLSTGFFGKISHISLHNIARSSTYIFNASSGSQRYSILTNVREAPDNGDRLVVANFDIPGDYNYNLVRIVRNDIRQPYFESDGEIVYEGTPIYGANSVSLPADYDVNSNIWFRIFTQNSIGNWCPISDATISEQNIPDQSRPTILENQDGTVIEINPGPGLGSQSAPNITVSQAGNEKAYLRWNELSSPATRVRIFYSTTDFPFYNTFDKYIEGGEEIYNGVISVLEFVNRNLNNLKAGFYSIVSTDRLGRYSTIVQKQITPMATANDSGIPLLEPLNVAYHLYDIDQIQITWDSPISLSSGANAWFDETAYVYGAICDIYGNALEIDYPNNLSLSVTTSNVVQNSVENVFSTNYTSNDLSALVNSATTISGGLITGQIKITPSQLLASIVSLEVTVGGTYNYSSDFVWTFPSLAINFNNPLSITLENRDNIRLNTGDFGTPCANKYESGGSDDPKSSYAYRVNGCYIRATTPYVIRAVFTYKNLPLQSGTVSALLFDAILDTPCSFTVPSLTIPSTTVLFNDSQFPIQYATIPILDSSGNDTGETQNASYADIALKAPYLPQSARAYVEVSSNGFFASQRMNMYFPTILKMSLTATAPLSNGLDTKEQFSSAWFIDPDHPKDQSKIQVVPDKTIIQWAMVNKNGRTLSVPFYSTDSVPLTNGIYSYTRSGTARQVFFGPARTDSEGTYTLTASTAIQGLNASISRDISIIGPNSSGGGPGGGPPNPLSPRILAEMPECINYMWADGRDYVKMTISRNPSKSTTKYAEKFRSCSLAANNILYTLPVGTVVTVNAPGYTILWGTVIETVNPSTGEKTLITDNAYKATNSANVQMENSNYTYVYFQQNSLVNGIGCRPVTVTNCCGFDMATTICDENDPIGPDTGVTVSASINLQGQLTTIYGGGPVGSDKVSRPPCAIVPKEPLNLSFIGIFVNNKISNEIVVDGITKNVLYFQMLYADKIVPVGTALNVVLVVNVNGKIVTDINGIDVNTYFGIPSMIYTTNTTLYPGINDLTNTQLYSIASLTINPIPINNNIAIGIGVSTTYNGD
jgi:Concanavalin A-like lectin/glucanases superfamily